MTSKLGRTKDKRDQVVKNLATSLVVHGAIVTTLPKAKLLSRYIEQMLTRAKQDTLSARRAVSKQLNSKQAAAKIFDLALPNLKNTTSGFTSIVKLENRKGDNATMAKISLASNIFEAPVKTEKKDKESTKPAKIEKAIKE